MELNKIKSEDLIFSGDLEDDRTNTFLTLNDYDWMNYTLQTRFKTDALGELQVKFSYYGFTTSDMEVTRIKGDVTEEYKYTYPTDLFQNHITSLMMKHIASWNSEYAFNGEDEVIDFFNDVVEQGELEVAA